MAWLPVVIKACYFLAALLFILGLKRMSSPRTARGGILWAGVGMLVRRPDGNRSASQPDPRREDHCGATRQQHGPPGTS